MTTNKIPITPRLKKVFAQAEAMGQLCERKLVSTDHLLIALLGTEGGPSEHLLKLCGYNQADMQQKLLAKYHELEQEEIQANLPKEDRVDIDDILNKLAAIHGAILKIAEKQ